MRTSVRIFCLLFFVMCTKPAAKTYDLYLKVDKMTCSGCVKAITARLKAIDGIRDVVGDPKKKSVHIIMTKEIAQDTVRNALKEIDYEPSKITTKRL